MAKKRKEPELAVEYVGIETILPYQNNARAHGETDVDAIMASIREFGFNDPIGVWKNIIDCVRATERSCYMMELDPKYVDVIIDRWGNFSSKKLKKIL